MYKREDASARFYDRVSTLTDLYCNAAALWIVVGAGTIEEAVTQCNSLKTRIAKKAILDLSVCGDSSCDPWGCAARKIFVFRCQTLTWAVEEAGRLHDISLDGGPDRDPMQVSSTLKANLTITGCSGPHILGSV